MGIAHQLAVVPRGGRFGIMVAVTLVVRALLGVGPMSVSAADMVWVGNDAFNNSSFSASGNWQGNTLPSWGYTNNLKFNQNQRAGVTGLLYDWGDWRQVNDIFWDSTFPVSRTLSSSSGGGINYKLRIENNSFFAPDHCHGGVGRSERRRGTGDESGQRQSDHQRYCL